MDIVTSGEGLGLGKNSGSSFAELVKTSVEAYVAANEPSFVVVSGGEFDGLSEFYAQIHELEERLGQMENGGDDSLEEVRQKVEEDRAGKRDALAEAATAAQVALKAAQDDLSKMLEEQKQPLDRDDFLRLDEGVRVREELERLESAAKKHDDALREYDRETGLEVVGQHTAKTAQIGAALEELRFSYSGSDAEKHDNWVLFERRIEGLLTQPEELLSRENVRTVYGKLGVEDGDKKIQELFGASGEAIRQQIEAEQSVELLRGLSWQFYDGAVSSNAQNSELVQALNRDMDGWDVSVKTEVYRTFEEDITRDKSRGDIDAYLEKFPRVKAYIESKVGERVGEVLEQKGRFFASQIDDIERTVGWVREQYIQSELSLVRQHAAEVDFNYASAIRLDAKKISAQDGGTWGVDRFAEALDSSPGGTFAGRSRYNNWPIIKFSAEQEAQKSGLINSERLAAINEEKKELTSKVTALGINSSDQNLHEALSREIYSLEEKRLNTPFGFINRFFNRKKDHRIRVLTELDKKLSDLEGEGGRIRYEQETLGHRSNEFTQARKRIIESFQRLPGYMQEELDSFQESVPLARIIDALNGIKKELWGEPAYSTPAELVQARAQLAWAKDREEKLVELKDTPFGLGSQRASGSSTTRW